MTNTKWYNSAFLNYVGQGLGWAALLCGIAYSYRYCEGPTERQVEIETIRAKTPTVQVADLNGNGIADKFYVVDGKVAVVELDGKPVSNSLDSKVLGK